MSSDPANPDRPEHFTPLSPEAWAERLSRRTSDDVPPADAATGSSDQAGGLESGQAEYADTAPQHSDSATGHSDTAAQYSGAAPHVERAEQPSIDVPHEAPYQENAASGEVAGAVADPHPWPDETASTSEAAIVNAATSPLVFQRLSVWKDELLAWFRTLLSAAVYATLIVTFGFQVARVEGESMKPTLSDQDRLIVNKLVYRLGPPRRDDIVMLYYPVNPDKSFVKRVIAEEGDTVKIEDGRVYVNDVPLNDDEYVPEEYRSHDDYPPQVIKEGYYYVLGDHRNNSSDSRHWGEVPKKYIIGRVWLRWWPIDHARIF